ncbi:MAG: ABC transporter permease [Wenzhouxiangellaceae bacterium]|nr:ABC transporter permease [Wenzhouxiangellaceae bacterium]
MLMQLARGSLVNRRWPVALTITTIAIAIALVVLVEQLRGQVREGFYRSVSGTDLIVGAPTAPVQLLLNTVFGLGDPNRNVSREAWQQIAADPRVAWTIPISLGDAWRGQRVIGTSSALFEHYRHGNRQPLAFAAGRAFEALDEVVVGAAVARRHGLTTGDELVLAHGSGNVSLHHHDDQPFVVSGVLAATGTPVDQSLYISLTAHRAIHRGWEQGVPPRRAPAADNRQRSLDADHDPHDHAAAHGNDAHAGHEHEDEDGHDHAADEDALPDQISAFYVGLNTRAAAFALQYEINRRDGEPLLAMLPGIALQELWRITAAAEGILRMVSALVVLAGLLGMLAALLSTLEERRREMAILRACGARPWQVSGLLVIEAALIVVLGMALGVALAAIGLWLAAPLLLDRLGIAVAFQPFEPWQWQVLATIAGTGILVALLPAAMAYRRTLSDGMQVRL